MTCRLNIVPSRVHWLFRGVTSTSCSDSSGQKSYPERCSDLCLKQPQACLDHFSRFSCGRGRLHRRLHRPSFQVPTGQLLFATMNVQSLRLDLIAHRLKLQELICTLRNSKIHICCLQEMRSASVSTEIFYIEEYCFVVSGRMAIAMVNSVALLWEKHGRHHLVRPDGASDRILSVVFPFRGLQVSVTAASTPSSQYIGDKRAHYTQCLLQHRALRAQGCVQLWGGDFNGHIAKGDGPSTQCGNYGLTKSATTLGGKALCEWLSSTDLAVADTFQAVSCRGTWLHPHTKEWYELDYLLVDSDRLHQVQPRMRCVPGVADHRMKVLGIQLGSLTARASRKRRAQTWKSLSRPRDRTPKLCMQAFRGNSEQAVAARKQFGLEVEAVLSSMEVPAPPVSHAIVAETTAVEGWEEPNNTIAHSYTDGSYTPSSSSTVAKCGSGVYLWLAQNGYSACRPVSTKRNFISHFSNNVAELDAILMVLDWLYSHQSCVSRAVIHYDSEYGMHVATGQWRAMRNLPLVGKIKDLLAKLSVPLQWRWIRGHSSHAGNDKADELAAAGASGKVLTLPAFTATASGPQRLRLSGKHHRQPMGSTCSGTSTAPSSLPKPDVSWDALSQLLVHIAGSIVGTRPAQALWSPYTNEDHTSLALLQKTVAETFDKVAKAGSVQERVVASQEHKRAKQQKQIFQRKCRKRWIQQVVQELEDCSDVGNWGRFYWLLRRIGITVQGTSAEGKADFSPAQLRAHALKIGQKIAPDVDLDMLEKEIPQQPVQDALGQPPTDQEFFAAVHCLRESAPGPDQVTILMLRSSGPRALWQVRLLVHEYWTTEPDTWEQTAKQVIGVPLYKGDGSRQELDNYRYIMLINVISRIMGRIVADRVQQWAEQQNLYGQWQWGFRRGRSCVDVLLLIRTLVELASAVSPDTSSDRGEHYDNLVLIMFDIMKAYSKIQRSAAWVAFRRLGMPESMLRVIQGLHEFSEYRMRTPGGDSDSFSMALGFREGCCSSPALYNLWHCLAMKHYRKLEDELLTDAQQQALHLQGIPGRPFHLRVRGVPQKNRHLLQRVRLGGVTFADDTSLCCRLSTCQAQEALLRTTLEQWGETIKDAKTKRLVVGAEPTNPVPFATVESAKLLGGHFQADGGYSIDDSHRLSRAKTLWRSLKRKLPSFGLNRRLRGRLISASVIRCLLYGVQCREVSGSTARKWQTWLNSVAREATKTRLQDMHDQQLTQQDVNKSLGLWPVKVYIGQAQLLYVAHVARLPLDRPERIALFGWLSTELAYNTGKHGSKSRRQLWQRILELMALAKVATSDVASTWESLAQRDGGSYWKSLVKQWCTAQLACAHEDTWLERHKDVAARRRYRSSGREDFSRTWCQSSWWWKICLSVLL